MDRSAAGPRLRDMQAQLNWTDADAIRVHACEAILSPAFPAVVEDFYERIGRHPEASRALTGGIAQLERLRGLLGRWLEDLVRGPYDEGYAARRWQVGLRHAEIGLDFVQYNLAMAHIRSGLQERLHAAWIGEPSLLSASSVSLDKLLDLELALVGDAYQRANLARQQRIERLATLGQIAGGVAHELRNPLNVIKTSVYYLRKAGCPTREKQEEHLRRIERHIELADGVISALDGFVSTPAPRPRLFAAKSAIADALVRTPGPHAILISMSGLEDLPPVYADEAQIGTVFSNLIRNASEAMTEGGLLHIRGESTGGLVEISFSDHGPGIPREHLAKIQEPFFTTKPRGLGLGLAIGRSILDRNECRLTVSSEPGRGSTFTVTLPTGPPSGTSATVAENSSG